VLSWEASRRIHDTERLGHVDLDWSVTGGVLFGKQKTTITGVDERVYYEQKYNQFPNTPVNASAQPLSIAPRSTSVTIPTLGVALGLSYAIDRIKVGAGYRWERYFDAIDGGIAEHKSYDRTIDGPYFKIAVGFGG
jgi:opacity protein-like surface antigen